MTPVALDGTKLIILMIAGGVFALAGLWLMFRPQRGTEAGDAAKIELFGLKFQSSSAGLLVFLIGAVFLAVPIVVPEKPTTVTAAAGGAGSLPATGAPVRSDEGGGEPASATPPRASAETGQPSAASTDASSPATAGAAPPARPRATGRETEPNEQYEGANRLALGDSLAGALSRDEEDWFAIAAGGEQSRIEARVRSNSDCTGSYIYAYSPEERQLLGGAEDFGQINTSKTWTIDTGGAAWIFVRLQNAFGSNCDYELFTGPATD